MYRARNTALCEGPITKWLKSQEYAKLNGTYAKPMEHPVLLGTPLSSQKGQAEAFCLIADDSSKWILKKFYKAKDLERSYLDAVTNALPKEKAFVAGTGRQVLSSSKLANKSYCYYSNELASFIDGTVLMPRINGIDWSCLADHVRNGEKQLPRSERLEISVNLARAIRVLENNRCSHRDLSSGNIFIDPATREVYLIDFDSLYHPSLKMPEHTTCGTPGYIPRYAWWAGDLCSGQSWCEFTDRFALTLLITEFLIIGKGAPLTSDGGIFDQDELRKGTGRGIADASAELKKSWPSVYGLFDKTLSSNSFSQCPSPSDWIKILETLGVSKRQPQLKGMPSFVVTPGKKTKAPKLSDIAVPNFKVKTVKKTQATKLPDAPQFNINIKPKITLPDNPWK